MSIGSTIKRLRREKNITQEQLAEYLGITSRAISQWECDRTAPDLAQLPALCHIFDVTSDILLGIDIEKNNEEIIKYLTEANDLGNQNKNSERTALLREANKKFPRNYVIMHRLADSIVYECSRKGSKKYDEAIELCKQILAECTDSITRYEAINTLGTAYGYAEKYAEMLKLADEMPHIRFSYEEFMRYRWKGDEGFNEFQDYVNYLIERLVEMISIAPGQRNDNGEYIYSYDDRIRMLKTSVSLLELLFPDGDYQFKAQLGEQACSHLCSTYLDSQNYEEAWCWLEKGAEFAIHMDTYDFEAPHTSPVLLGHVDGGWIVEENGNHTQFLLEWLTASDETEVFRSDARCDSLVERLKKAAKS